MKRIVCLLVALVGTLSLGAQTPQEILTRMEQEMNGHESEGVFMALDAKVPVMGTMHSKSWMRGEKARMEMTMMGVTVINWYDETTEWEYNSKSNELTISLLDTKVKGADKEMSSDRKSKEESSELSMLGGLSEGYELAVTAETETHWVITGKRLKTNNTKKAPKTFELTVSKVNFLPETFTAKISGVKMTMHDIRFGISEAQVTFNPADYPDAIVIDKR